MNNQSQKTYSFHVEGMHCQSCVLVTEGELCEHPLVLSAVSKLETQSVDVTGAFGDMLEEDIVQQLNTVLTKHGYTLVIEKPYKKVNWADFIYAVPLAFMFVLLFVLLQKMGVVNLINPASLSLPTAFLIGIVASLSTCMAVVGGLVLSMSATLAKQGEKIRPHIFFHVGRLVAFFLFGGLIGIVGLAFTLSSTATFILSIFIGVVMFFLGINLLDIVSFKKTFGFTMPKYISKNAVRFSKMNHATAPLLFGAATFFLPCGFTQAMQIYTLSAGSFLSGALIMTSFAIGTLPVLALISFSLFRVTKGRYAGVFLKTAGLIVILFALFNVINGLVVIGVLSPLFTF